MGSSSKMSKAEGSMASKNISGGPTRGGDVDVPCRYVISTSSLHRLDVLLTGRCVHEPPLIGEPAESR